MSENLVIFKKKRKRDESSTKPKSTLNEDEENPQIHNVHKEETTKKQNARVEQEENAQISVSKLESDSRVAVEVERRKGKTSSFYGPVKASSNVRTSTMFDYKPDICKDYKQTGYCGYGDACIFLHDRGDYKFGWEIEKDWEEEQRKKRLGKTDKEKEQVETSKSAISTDCPICSKKFVNPVKSKCGHLFCEECALQYHKEHKKCAVCTLVTDGIFSSASDYLAKLKA